MTVSETDKKKSCPVVLRDRLKDKPGVIVISIHWGQTLASKQDESTLRVEKEYSTFAVLF